MDGDKKRAPLVFPAQFVIDYEKFCGEAATKGKESAARFLAKELLYKWRELYVKHTPHATNIVRFPYNTFEYFYDHYSALEERGEVPYSQTIEDRLVGVIGVSAPTTGPRNPSRLHGWLGPTEKYLGKGRDKGHLMAHYIGGGLDVNVFSQDRALNRGWSAQGKVYRRMEAYCYEHAGTLCFSRPIYADSTSVPRWLEFGLVKDDGTLWVEVFDNGQGKCRTAPTRS
jgi:hypothetical protein